MTIHTAEEIYEFGLEAYKRGDRVGANTQFEKCALVNPTHAKAHAMRGVIAFEQGRTFDAFMNYAHSLAIAKSPEAYNNMGSALAELEQWDQAIKCYRLAIANKPDLYNGWNNLGRAMLITGELEKAKECFEKSIEFKPDYAEAHMGLAFDALELGEFELGWKEYEWRLKMLPPRHELLKQWNGEELGEDGLVLSTEQGIGDGIQFCRYAPLIKGFFGGKVYIETRPSLYRLLKTLDGIDGVIAYGDPLPKGTKYTRALMSCPLVLKHFHEEQFPRSQSYLRGQPGRIESFREYFKLLRDDVPRVGICWAGSAALPCTDRRRSTNLEQWVPLGKVDGIGWVTLQKGPPADQLRTTQHGMTVLDVIGECDDMLDTAALIEHCDLVISVDTAVLHLAAALGKPTWLLSRRDVCWRWLGDRKDNPWYPTLKQYRQPELNDWESVFTQVASDLKVWLTGWRACRSL